MADTNGENLSPLQRALLAVKEMKARLEASERAKNEPIAVIGMGCRFPGGANNPAAFWQLLRDGVDAVGPVPADRWDGAALHDPDFLVAGKTNTREAAFLERVDLFDAAFFGLSPREAARMDPQQRLLLEITYEALEAAGQPLEALAGSPTGVFIGVHSHSSDYAWLQVDDLAAIDMHTSTGTAHSIIANRLSYVFDFQGPSLALDTACSSSLVAVHLACQSLRSRECNLALAGGTNLILTPEFTVSLSKMQALAPDGRCKTFDAAADGFGRGEGCGVVVLKRLSDALADRDPILAVIAGSAVNQDGTTNGLTAPNGLSQQAVIRRALANAGVRPEQISYVETHGTGTVLGDPIEVEALAEVIGGPRPAGEVCVLGSVKTNIGHLEGAAGVAGLMKVILSLQHQRIPRHLHFQKLNPHISLEGTPFVIPTTERPWPAGAPRYAGISSFGFGGTNAHVIVTDPPPQPAIEQQKGTAHTHHLLTLSARSPEALRELAAAYRPFLTREDAPSLADICYTASQRRSHHPHRLALVGDSPAGMAERLAAFERGEAHEDVVMGEARPPAGRGLVFVFSGQGNQLWGMGQELLATEPVFRAKVAECDELLRPYTGWSLLDELTAGAEQSRLEENEVAQPALFAVQVALAALWESWGVRPDAVVGHSVGEVAAAHVAGVLSLADAVRVIYHRGRVIQKASGSGRMAVTGLSQAEAESLLAGYQGRLSLAAANSPTSTVLSGEPAALEEVLRQLEAQGRFGRLLPAVNYASHSHVMEPFSQALVQSLAGLQPRPASIPIYSTVSGTAGQGEAFDAAYWGRNLRRPVLFAPAVAELVTAGFHAFLEIGPHPLLAVPLAQCLEAAGDTLLLASLHRERPERQTLLRALAGLYAHGYPVHWPAVISPAACVPLPAYPWQHRRYWLEARRTPRQPSHHTVPVARPASLPLHRLRTPQPTFEATLSTATLPYLAEHRLYEVAVLPTTVLAEMVQVATGEVLGQGTYTLSELAIEQALPVPADPPATVQLLFTVTGQKTATFQLFSQQDESGREWTLHATGTVGGRIGGDAPPLALLDIQARCQEADVAAYYEQLAGRGLHLGRTFQGMQRLWRGAGEALGRIASSGTDSGHPAFLDACLQPLAAALPGGENYLLIGLEQLQAGALPAVVWSHARLRDAEAGETVTGDVVLYDETGRVVGQASGVLLKRAGRTAIQRLLPGTAEHSDWLYDVVWQPKPLASAEVPPAEPGQWLLFGAADALTESFAALLRERGEAVVLVTAGACYEAVGKDHYQLDPQRPDDFRRLLVEVTAEDRPLQGAVYLWAAQAGGGEEVAVEALTAGQTQYAGGALHLMQALAQTPARLWLVTRGAQPLDDRPVRVAQATLWGLGRVMALEYSEQWGGLIDLGDDPPSEEAEKLWREIGAAAGTYEDQVAWRGHQRMVARLARSATPLPPAGTFPFPLTPGAHLLTGGLGGLGLKVAHWLAAQGARHLVLTSRSGLPAREEWDNLPAGSEVARRVAAVQALEALGVTVTVAAVDVADEAQMAALLAQFGDALPPLRGVMHIAAALDATPLEHMKLDDLQAMFRAKVAGSWVLHRLTREMALDYFVLFSSTTALWGVSGMAHYAAANCFLDVLAHYRRAQGLPALSVNWGLWEERRHFSNAEQEQVARFGLEPMPAGDALALLRELLAAPDSGPQKVVAAVDWATLKPAYEARRSRPFLEQVGKVALPARTPAGLPALVQQLEAVPPAERSDFLLDYVRQQVARVMGHEASQLDVQRGLFEIGMDSLMAVELRNRLESSSGRRLPATLIFNYPHIQALAGYLQRELLGGEMATTTVVNGDEREPAGLESVSEDELLALFDEELAAIEDLDL